MGAARWLYSTPPWLTAGRRSHPEGIVTIFSAILLLNLFQKAALDVLFSLLKHLSTSLTNANPDSQPQLHFSHFKHIAHALLLCPPSTRHGSTSSFTGKIAPDVRDYFVATWFNVHDDIRWCFLREATYALRLVIQIHHVIDAPLLASFFQNTRPLTTLIYPEICCPSWRS